MAQPLGRAGPHGGRFRPSLAEGTIVVPPPRTAWLGGGRCTNSLLPGRIRAGPRVAAGRRISPRSRGQRAACRLLAGFAVRGKIGEAFAREPIDFPGD